MDLRKERTKQNIRDAYMELRKTKPIEKITVKEIADLAMINKATFYRHYEDIYQLTDEIEYEVIDHIIELIKSGADVSDMVTCFTDRLKDLCAMLSYTRRNTVVEKQHDRLMTFFTERHPELQNDIEKKVVITAIIVGCIASFTYYHGEDSEEVKRGLHTVADLLRKTLT